MLMRTIIIVLVVEVSVGLCGECRVTRIAKNNGMHRDIVTEIVLIGVSSSPLNCKVMLIEFIPSGLYIDTHQVRTIGHPKIYSASKIDVEGPEYISHSYELYVWHQFTMNTSQSTTVMVNLPVHIRYHRPSTEMPSNVILEPPRIFAQCEGSDFVFQRIEGTSAFSPCDANNMSSLCEWRELHCSSQPSNQRLEFVVPVGNPDHLMPVIVITVMFTVCGCMALIYYIFTANNIIPPRQSPPPQQSPSKQGNSSKGGSHNKQQQQQNHNSNASNHSYQNNQQSKSNNQRGGQNSNGAESQQAKMNSNQSHGAYSNDRGGGKNSGQNNLGKGDGGDVGVNHSMKNSKDSNYNLRKRAGNEKAGK